MRKRTNMSVSLIYNIESESQVVSLTILREYTIMWHFTEQEGREIHSFDQSRHVSESEWKDLSKELSILFEQKQIPSWIMDVLEEQVCIE